MRTRMVLHEKGIGFEVHEVDLSNKSEEFLSVSPYGKVPVLTAVFISSEPRPGIRSAQTTQRRQQ
jgi:glutathione S-transferase